MRGPLLLLLLLPGRDSVLALVLDECPEQAPAPPPLVPGPLGGLGVPLRVLLGLLCALVLWEAFAVARRVCVAYVGWAETVLLLRLPVHRPPLRAAALRWILWPRVPPPGFPCCSCDAK